MGTWHMAKLQQQIETNALPSEIINSKTTNYFKKQLNNF